MKISMPTVITELVVRSVNEQIESVPKNERIQIDFSASHIVSLKAERLMQKLWSSNPRIRRLQKPNRA
jgi:hypothetical protein